VVALLMSPLMSPLVSLLASLLASGATQVRPEWGLQWWLCRAELVQRHPEDLHLAGLWAERPWLKVDWGALSEPVLGAEARSNAELVDHQ